MRMLQVLPEVVGAVELLVSIALAELVRVLQVADALLPVLLADGVIHGRSAGVGRGRPRGRPRASEVLAAEPACVASGARRALVEGLVITR